MSSVRHTSRPMLWVVSLVLIAFLACVACIGLTASFAAADEAEPEAITDEQDAPDVDDADADNADDADADDVDGWLVRIDITCTNNLLFDQYDLNILVDDENVLTMAHGDEVGLGVGLETGMHTLTIAKQDDPDVYGSVRIPVTYDCSFGYEVTCYDEYVEITPVASSFEQALVAAFPQDEALQLATITMAGAWALADGSIDEDALPMSYDDATELLEEYDPGLWLVVDAYTWHVSRLVFAIGDTDQYLDATMDITFDDVNYTVSNASYIIATRDELAAGDASLSATALPDDADYLVFAGDTFGDEASSIEDGTDDADNPSDADTSGATLGQQDALHQAQLDLEATPLSYFGLVIQLESEGFEAEDATWAADNCGADWNEQAAAAAANYLSGDSSLSQDDLVDRLLDDGFTEDQATYGASNANTVSDSNESTTTVNDSASSEPTLGQQNALKTAERYLRVLSYSYSGLISQLEFEGYTTEEAIWAADNCGADWNEQAAATAERYLKYLSYSRDGLISQLLFEGFTEEQAEYGVTAVGY